MTNTQESTYTPNQLEFWTLLSTAKQRDHIRELLGTDSPISSAAVDFVRALLQKTVVQGHEFDQAQTDHTYATTVDGPRDEVTVRLGIDSMSSIYWDQEVHFDSLALRAHIEGTYRRLSRVPKEGSIPEVKELTYSFAIDPQLAYEDLDRAVFDNCGWMLASEAWDFKRVVNEHVELMPELRKVNKKSVVEDLAVDRFKAECLLIVQESRKFAPGLRLAGITTGHEPGMETLPYRVAPTAVFEINGTQFRLHVDNEDPNFPRTFSVSVPFGEDADQMRSVIDPDLHTTEDHGQAFSSSGTLVVHSRKAGNGQNPFRASDQAFAEITAVVTDIALRIGLDQHAAGLVPGR